MSADSAAKSEAVLNRNERKWGRKLWAAGWTAIPTVLLERQHRLGLQPLDLNIILQLAKHWWHADQPPFPAKGTIARCIGVSPRTVQRRLSALVQAKLIERIRRKGSLGGTGSNAYTFVGLIRKATPHAEEMKEQRAERVRLKDAGRRRRAPALQLVKPRGR
jgi:DNA-binding transcriptional regulator YhcF (GntR family)